MTGDRTDATQSGVRSATDRRQRDREEVLTRRRLLAGSAILVGGAGTVVDSTAAMFSTADNATGSVQIHSDPTLDVYLDDQTTVIGVQYEIQYEVEWLTDFDEVVVAVENLDNDAVGETVTGDTPQGSVTYPSSGFYDDGSEGDEYQFTVEVYENGSATPVIVDQYTDVADSSSSGDPIGSVDDPVLESYTVTDDTSGNTTRYTVDYQLSNVNSENFSEVVVTFDDTEYDLPPATESSSDQPTGSVSYSVGWGLTVGDPYEITIEVRNDAGLTVDSAVVTDSAADGVDP